MSTSDAVTREVAWLATTGDSLPALLKTGGGPWDVVQAYWPRTPATRQTGIYVTRKRLATVRFSAQRRIATHSFRLRLIWPVGATTTGTGLLEAEQQALDDAVDLLRQRVEGLLGDKTHGGRFLSVGEAPEHTAFDVDFDPPEQATANGGQLGATATYLADDRDYTM